MTIDNIGVSQAEPTLSWHRQDIEQRLMFRGARFTQVNYLLSSLIAFVLTGCFYLIVILFPGSYFYVKFMGSGRIVDVIIPFATMLLAFWCVTILFFKSRKLAFQKRSLDLQIVPDTPDFVLSSATVGQILDQLYQIVDDPKQFVLFNRIEIALGNLRNMGRIADVDEILRSQHENDESFLDATYIVLGGFMWAIPILGFIGTVLGLSIAIGQFSVVLKSHSQDGGLIEPLKGVVAGLGTAFDTTLIALVAALLIQMWITFLRKSEQEFLDSCSEYCLRRIVNRLRIMPYQSNE